MLEPWEPSLRRAFAEIVFLWLLFLTGIVNAQTTSTPRNTGAELPAADPGHAEPASTSLLPFARARETSSVDFRVGDRLYGPGPVTAGWAGSKKQLVVPGGEWIVLAAVDHNSTHVRPVPLTSVALGQFVGTRLESLLVATFNRRAGLPGHTWTDATQCEVDDGRAILHQVEGPFGLRRCLLVKKVSANAQRPLGPVAIWPSILIGLEGLGSAPGSFNLETIVIVVDSRAAYLRVVRLDCVGPRPNGSGCMNLAADKNGAAAQALASRVGWGRAYLQVAAQGFGRDIPGDDLRAGQRGLGRSMTLAD
jgi:hypothetical protein